MLFAAVPNYLGSDFKDASPGMRFGMYLQLWGVDQGGETLLREKCEVKPENKKLALGKATILNENDRKCMSNLLKRQQQDLKPSDANHRFEAIAISPFTTGLGNEHPLENGFAFLNPYGLPYLPGSGIKGVLRQAARELASGEWGDAHDWSEEETIEFTIEKKQIQISIIDVLFGLESLDGEKEHLRGALTFWDVIPQIEGDRLSVEIMTPHQSHYYQKKKDERGGESFSPHDSGQLNPINFLTVPPKSRFVFHVQCDLAHLKRHAPELAQNSRWKTLLESAFDHAYQWLGFGAKTAVGYGAMESEAMRKAREKAEEARREAENNAEEQRKQALAETNAEIWEGARIKYNKDNKSLSVEKNNKTAYAIYPKGQELFNGLPADVLKKIETNPSYVKVNARVSGTELLGIIT